MNRGMTIEQVKEVALRGVRFGVVDEAGFIAWAMGELEAGRGRWVVTPNLDIVRRVCAEEDVRRLVDAADLRVADGWPIVLAAKLQGTPLPGRVTGSGLIHTLTAAAAAHGRSVFFLGGEDDTAERAAAVLKERSPALRVAGSYCPPFGFEKDAAEMTRIEAVLRDSGADVVYVALGFPKAERLIAELRGRGVLPAALWIGVGISFSYVCGHVKRAPGAVRAVGLEWLYRLLQEPRRLGRRYVVEGPPFAARLLVGAALARKFEGRRSKFERRSRAE